MDKFDKKLFRQVLKEVRNILLINIKELVEQHKAVEGDWNSNARQELAGKISQSTETLMALTHFMKYEMGLYNGLDEEQ